MTAIVPPTADDAEQSSAISDIWPLTPLQRGLLFHSLWERDAGAAPTYLLQVAVEVAGPLDEAGLRSALAAVLDDHDNLRVGFFAEGESDPVQFVSTEVAPVFTSDLVPEAATAAVGEAATHPAVAAVADEEWATGFDLRRPPLVRARWLMVEADRGVLLLTVHHLIVDGWSLPLLVEQILERAWGTTPDPAPAFLDYLDLVLPEDDDQRERAETTAIVTALADLDEPTLVAPAAANAGRGQRRTTTIDRGPDLRAAARALGVTPAAIIAAAWAQVLGRLTNRDDVVFGLTVSGRNDDVPGIDRIIGLLGNTLPFRMKLTPGALLAELARAAHRRSGTLAGAQAADLGAVQTACGHGVLFDSLLVIENYPGEIATWRSPDGAVQVRGTWSRDAVHYPLALVVQIDDSIRLDLTVSSDVPAGSDLVSGYLHHAITALLDHPELATGRALTEAPLPGYLDGGPPPDVDLASMLDDARSRYGDRVAVVDGTDRITLADLHNEADTLRSLLAGEGTLAVLAPRSAMLVVGVLAALEAGRPFLLLDPGLPVARLANLLDEAGADEVVVADEARHLTSPLGLVGSGPVRRRAGIAPPSANGFDPDAAAYVVFTSGTTGQPKGCVNSRRGLAVRLAWMRDRYEIGADDVILHKTPVSFDVSVWELVLPLVTGARLVIAPPAAHRDPEAIDALVAAEGVTIVHFVPSMLAAYLALVPRPAWSGLRHLICSGEPLPAALARDAGAAADRAGVHNLYGPAEAAIDVTAGDNAHQVAGLDAPIGVAVPGTVVRVLDHALRPVGVGGTGELYLAGPQLAMGYAGRSRLTAERFVADPVGTGARLYRTGDLVEVAPNGLVHRGRSDDQVKVRGMRVEPGETRAALEARPDISRAAVIMDPTADSLVAIVTPTPGTDLDLDHVDLALSRSLPEAQRPSAIVLVDVIPTTTNGKLDRGEALALVRSATANASRPGGRRDASAGPVSADPVVARLADIARTVIGAPVDPDADLLASGLDSVSAIRYVALARRSAIDIGLDTVFAERTTTAIAAAWRTAAPAVRTDRSTAETPSTAGSDRLVDGDEATRQALDRIAPHREAALPLGPLQHGLYVHSQLGGDELDVYVVQHKLRLRSDVDCDALRRAGDALLRRHPNLRAGFVSNGLRNPLAVISPAVPIPFRALDYSHLTSAEQDDALDRLTEGEVEEGFDLAHPPLIRLVAVRLGAEHWMLSLIHHHILTDGWSQTIMLEDLFQLYNRALATPGPVSDADLDPPADYNAYLDWVSAQDHETGVAVWRRELDGLVGPTVIDPRSLGSTPVLSDSARHLIDAGLTSTLTGLARDASVTLSTVLSYAWALVLRQLTGQHDIVFGTTVSGRPAEVDGVDRMVGLLMNTVPVRVRIRPGDQVIDQLRTHMAAQARVMPAHHVGLGYVQDAAGTSGLFDTLYVFRNLPVDQQVQSETFARHRITEAEAYDGTHYTLAMTVNPGDRLELALAYRPDLVEAVEAERYLDRYVQILAELAERRHQPIATVRALTPADEPLIGRVNAEATVVAPEQRCAPDGDLTVADLLFEAAATWPERTALVGRDLDGGDTAWTFAELADRVEHIAALVAAHTSGREAVVALALPRTVEHVAAIFGVMRAGRAYLPLDPTHPPARQSRLAAAASAELVLVAPTVDGPPGVPALAVTATVEGGPVDPPRMRPDELAYVIFTSGSTGEPKGVAVPHRGLVTMYDNHRETIFRPALARAGRSPLRIAHTVSFAFDMSWEEFFWLLDGHEVHVIDEDQRLDVASLVDHYAEVGIDVINVTPSYGREVFRAGLLRRRPPTLILLGGEAIPPDLWEQLGTRDDLIAYDLYGPTEFTINALGVNLAASPGPCLGRPILDARAYVLDSGLREVPPGGVGELYLGGAGLTRGYCGQPGLTAERYVADPFGAPGQRLYRTGDLVYRGHDGGIHYRGRGDDQVKVRGHRIELAEIEAVAEDCPNVAQAVASVHRPPNGADTLRLHLVPDADHAADRPTEDLAEVVKRHLAAALPGYSIPSQITTVGAIPLTSNGKIDRAALPAPDAAGGEPPAGRVEISVAEVYVDALAVTNVNRDDNFFDLGGHSLVAMRVAAGLTTALGTPVAVGLVMANPSVRALAAALATPARDAGLAPTLTLREPGEQPPLFAVHPAGGFAWQFAPLAALLPPGVGIIGLQADGLSGPPSAAVDVDALASEYLARVRDVQPSGPYRLLGYSFGGNIAHSMAAQLRAQGEEVELLGLIDPGPLGRGRRNEPAEIDEAEIRADQSEFLALLSGGGDLDEGMADAIRASKGVLGLDPAATLDAIVGCHRWAARLMADSVSPETAVPTLLVVAGREDPDPAAWDGLLGDDVVRVEIDTDHLGAVTPAAWDQISPSLLARMEHPG